MAQANSWTSFPDALRRAEHKYIDRQDLIAALIADLASNDTKATVRGWAKVTEQRFPTRAEEHIAQQAAEALRFLLVAYDEASPSFPHERARALKSASEFEPPQIITTFKEKRAIPTEFWSHCGPADSNGESNWLDDPEEPLYWTKVKWPLGQALSYNLLPGTLGDFEERFACWEFSGLEITTSAVEAAIRQLDRNANEERLALILGFPHDNYTRAWTELSREPAFGGFTKDLFNSEWKQHRKPGRRGRKAQARQG